MEAKKKVAETAALTMDSGTNPAWFAEPGRTILADALATNAMDAIEPSIVGREPSVARVCVEITEADGRCWLLNPSAKERRANPARHNKVKTITVRIEHSDGTVRAMPARWAASAAPHALIDDAKIMIADRPLGARIEEPELTAVLHRAFSQRYVDNALEVSDSRRNAHHLVMAKIEAAKTLSRTQTESEGRTIAILAEQHLKPAAMATGVTYTIRVGRNKTVEVENNRDNAG